jgi:hypothetical protein
MNPTTKVRRLASALVAVTAGAAVVLPASSAAAGEVEVNFDGGTPGAPCNFANTTALRNQYAGLGIRFRGTGPLDGGGVLDKCSNFGVDPHSGLRFLAFNGNLLNEYSDGGTPRGPEKILFNRRQKRVSIWVSQGGGTLGSPTFKLVGKRNGRTIRSTTATTNTSAWLQLSINNRRGFKKVVLSVTGDPNRAWVADDLVVRR